MFSLRRHIAIQSECDIGCRLCQAIGCVHPHQRDLDEIHSELDQALLSLCKTIVFPPNAFAHRDIAEIAELVLERGLLPIFRTRPWQYSGQSLELILKLASAGAEIELLIDRPTHPDTLDRIATLKKSKLRSLTPVLVPNKREDLGIVLDALPLEIRRELEILPLSGTGQDDHFFEPDELHAWLETVQDSGQGFRLKPYGEFDRTSPAAPPGFNQPGDFHVLFSKRKKENEILLSIVVPFKWVDQNLRDTVASFQKQNADAATFELILVKDGPSKNHEIETSLKALVSRQDFNWSVLLNSTPLSPVSHLQVGLSMNNGALFGVGTQIAFLESGVVAEAGWVQEAIAASVKDPVAYLPRLRPAAAARKECISVADFPQELQLLAPSSRSQRVEWQKLRSSCLSMPMRDFFEVGGFPRAFLGTNGFHITGLLWKLARLGKSVATRETGLLRISSDDERLKRPSPPTWRLFAASLRELESVSASAAMLYFMTMDADVYRCYFAGYGRSALARTLFRHIGKNRFSRPLLETLLYVFTAIRSGSPFAYVASSVLSGSRQLIIDLKERFTEARRGRAK